MNTATRAWIAALAATAATGLNAQGADVERELAEFRKLALKKVASRAEMQDRRRELGEWLRRVEGLDFGKHSYARAIAHYFNGDYDEAGAQLLGYHERHGGFPTTDYDALAGRMFMALATSKARAGDLGTAERAIPLALRYWSNPRQVYQGVGRALASIEAEGRDELLLDLTERLMDDDRVDAAARLAALRAMFGGRAERPARPARRRPTKIEPFTATDMDGKPISLADYKGKVVLVDFWATWCGPCLREMPNVVDAYREHHDQGFDVIGISLDRPNAEAKIREVAEKYGMKWRQIYDGGFWQAKLAVDNGIRSIPATFLFDRTGKCRASNLRGAALDREVRRLLAEKPGR